MSQLKDKILSYSPEGYIDFSQALTSSPVISPNTPSPALVCNNSLGSTSPTLLTLQATDNPPGGNGSWKWLQKANVSMFGLSWQGTGTTTVLNDGSYSAGVWFKLSAYPSGTSSSIYKIIGTVPRSTTSSSLEVTIVGSGATSFASRLYVYSKGAGAAARMPDLSYITPTLNEWHYVAIVKRSDGTGSVYYDGTLVRTVTGLATTIAMTNLYVGPNSSTNGTSDYFLSFSDCYIATPEQIDATQISQIYTAGSIVPITTKYWNGSAWTTPISKSQWDGSNWVTFNGKIWNGTIWQDIN